MSEKNNSCQESCLEFVEAFPCVEAGKIECLDCPFSNCCDLERDRENMRRAFIEGMKWNSGRPLLDWATENIASMKYERHSIADTGDFGENFLVIDHDGRISCGEDYAKAIEQA